MSRCREGVATWRTAKTFSPETSTRREVELIRLLTVEGTEPMRRLWLRKCSHTSNLYQLAAGQPSHRRAAACPPAQQNAGRQPKPAPAQAQAVPKPKTAAQLARRQRSLLRLQQKHLARALARERTAHGLRVWCARARMTLADERASVDSWPAAPIREAYHEASRTLRRLRCEYAARQPPPALALAAPSPPPPALAAPPPPALALAAPLPPSQQPPAALAAAARASLDEFEMQDDRGEKRDAHARTPPPPPPPSAPPPPSHGRRFA